MLERLQAWTADYWQIFAEHLPDIAALLDNPRPETIILLALAFDLLSKSAALTGILPGPVSGLAAFVGSLENKLNRPGRSRRNLAIRGLILLVVLGILAWSAGYSLDGVLAPLPQGWVVEVLVLSALLQFRLPFGQVLRLGKAIHKDDKVAMRQRARPFYGATAPDADKHALGRVAIEYLGQAIGTGLIGGIFWYLVGGLGGLFLYKMVLVMNHSWNDDAPQRRAFATGPAWLADMMSFPGCILALPVLTLSSLATPGGKPAYAFAVGLRGSGKYRNRSLGLVVGAMAGALGVSLGGPRNFGPLVKGSLRLQTPWIGANSGRARITVEDMRRALFLYLVAALLTLAGIGLWLNFAVQSGL